MSFLSKLSDVCDRPGFSLWDWLYIFSFSAVWNSISNMHDRASLSGITGIILLVLIPIAFLWFSVKGRRRFVVLSKAESTEDLADSWDEGYEEGFAVAERFAKQREALLQARQ